ncbi:hypothetical protein DTO164E3_9223 [Paecilomyces variotii]|nr:hypothetical protein DTO164E3_9223 [Paecilomyces variotii]KAJ9191966.1 hypothetical protein DTO032I3_8530 [Paecilomyces variotii]KAJ9275435.1 hypothetical protein DTO021D3_7731 [Paecilomyces variotii]KAJ9340007.1 hypothetical protein DTO027B6_7457 [Paecilomyces variotii]KAJ9358011.1 hypothetical protein DTO027B9_2581 [Paecilomyces variotii]
MDDDDNRVLEIRIVRLPSWDSFQVYYEYESSGPEPSDEDLKSTALLGPALPALGHALAGAAGAAVSNLATYPLNLIVARMQAQRLALKKKEKQAEGSEGGEKKDERYTSILDAARKIYAKEGIRGFYTGVGQDTGKTVADMFLFFLAYTFLRQRRMNSRATPGNSRKPAVLPIVDELTVGILAGGFSKLLTTPLSNIVTRKQTAAVLDESGSASTKDIVAKIRAEKGLKGFWAGYPAALILTLNPSITLFLNEILKYLLLPRSKRNNPPPAVVFLLAAISKVIASMITYPISLAKTRDQVSGANAEDSPSKSYRFVPRVLTTVSTIARTEGPGALYDGLSGEVLKGFFSHGITMLTKDAVHSLIVKTYYALLVLLRRYPSPDELLERARDRTEDLYETARARGKSIAGKVKDSAGNVIDTGNKVAGNVSVDMTSNGTPDPDSEETAELVHDYVEDEARNWRSLYHWFWGKK